MPIKLCLLSYLIVCTYLIYYDIGDTVMYSALGPRYKVPKVAFVERAAAE